jgi:hypothetical protein
LRTLVYNDNKYALEPVHEGKKYQLFLVDPSAERQEPPPDFSGHTYGNVLEQHIGFTSRFRMMRGGEQDIAGFTILHKQRGVELKVVCRDVKGVVSLRPTTFVNKQKVTGSMLWLTPCPAAVTPTPVCKNSSSTRRWPTWRAWRSD